MDRPESAPLSRLERRKARTRAAILTAAADLFSRQGYEGTSIADIAGQADTGVGTVYGYFSSKEEILLAVVRAWAEEAGEGYVRAVAGPSSGFEKLSTLLSAHAVFVRTRRPLIRAAIEVGARSGRPSLGIEWLVHLYARVLKEGIDRGEFRPVPLDTTARMLIGACTMATLHIGVWEEREDDDGIVADIVEIARTLLLRG